MGSTKEKKVFTPVEKTILVKPVMRSRNTLITDPKHEAFFLFGNATITLTLPMDRSGNLVNPFTSKEEQEWLEDELDIDLNYHKSKNNHWHTFKVVLGKGTKKLQLANPKQYLEYLLLRANGQLIAPNGAAKMDKATYRYSLESEEFENKKVASATDLKIKAYMALGKIKDDKEAMVNFLKVYGKKVAETSKIDFLVSRLTEIVDNDTNKFLSLINDKENYEIRLLIAEGVDCGAIEKRGRAYQLPGGDPLAAPGLPAVIDNVIDYLNGAAQQDVLLAIKTRVKNAKD